MRVLWPMLGLALFFPLSLQAQWTDSFADGDYSRSPVWFGDDSLWTIVPFGTDFALASNGPPRSDTLRISTLSAVSYGSWSFTFRYEQGRLSNFNLARVYLISDEPSPGSNTSGYFVQFGTNSHDIRLYRSDPNASDGRVLLAATAPEFLSEEDRTLSVEIVRDAFNQWTVVVDGLTALSVVEVDPPVETSLFFGLWVKHTTSRSQSYLFDDFDVSGSRTHPDVVPPEVVSFEYQPALPGLTVVFSETLDQNTIDPGAFEFSGGIGNPTAVVSNTSSASLDGYDLIIDAPLPDGSYELSISGVADLSGNVVSDTTLTFTVISDSDPPALLSAVAVDSIHIALSFDEPVHGCDPFSYEISDGVGSPAAVIDCPEAGADSLLLELMIPLESGRTYDLTVRNISDLEGNVLSFTTATFIYLGPDARPMRGDIAINEIFYAPPQSELEFVELFNLSDETFDLSLLSISDNRFLQVAISPDTRAFPPLSYVVLARDSLSFAAHFPGIPFTPVSGWPTLNNDGDTFALFSADVVIDSVAYEPSWGGSGVSLERRDPSGPSNARTNWGSSVAPEGASPNEENSLFSPDRTPPTVEFADLVDPETIEVRFDEPVDVASLNPTHFNASGRSPLTIDYDPDQIRLRLNFGNPITPKELRVERILDLTGNRLELQTIPVARLPDSGEIVINEIMFDPLADPFDGRVDQPEYLELFNPTDDFLSLRDFAWTNRPDETGVADTTHFVTVPSGIAPQNFIVVFSQPDDIAGDSLATASRLAAAFPSDYDARGVTLIAVRGASLGFRDDGALIRLHRTDGIVVDEVDYRPAWHNQGLASFRGISLERIDPLAASNQATNWASSVSILGGTPGEVNSVGRINGAARPSVGDLVINEIMYEPRAEPFDNRPDQPEYIELLSRAAVPLDLNGIFLSGPPDEKGSVDTLRIGFAPTALMPGRFAVAYHVSSQTPDDSVTSVLTGAFPHAAEDARSALLLPLRSTLGFDNDGDQIRLFSFDGTLIDDVSYAPSWHAPALRETRGTALERIDPTSLSNDAMNWTSSVSVDGGTPGAANSVFLRLDARRASPGITIAPSPFSPDGDGFEDTVGIQYRLKEPAGLIRVRIFDATGRLVRTLTNSQLSGNTGTLIWDGFDDHRHDLRIGIYVILLEAISSDRGISEAYKRPVVLARPLN